MFKNEELTKGLGMLNVLKHLVPSYLENFVIQFSEMCNQTTINRDVSRKQAIHLVHTVVFFLLFSSKMIIFQHSHQLDGY